MPQLNNEQLQFFYDEILGEFGWSDEIEESGIDPLKYIKDKMSKTRKLSAEAEKWDYHHNPQRHITLQKLFDFISEG